MTFGNPIVGGTTLIRPAIHSPDYVEGVSGWSINKDGTAEFNDVTFRGEAQSANYVPGVSGWKLDQGGDAEFNSIEIRSTGTETPITIGADNAPQVKIATNANLGEIFFPTNRPIENAIAGMLAGVLNSGLANEAASLQLFGPTVDGATDRASVLISSQNNDGSSNASVNIVTATSTVSIDKAVFQVLGQRFVVAPVASANSAIFLSADAGHTGNMLRLQKGGADMAIVDNSGNLTVNNIQKALVSVTTIAGQWVEQAVVFPHAFDTIPVVTVSGNSMAPAVGGATQLFEAATNITTTGFTLRVFRSTAITMNYGYIAIA
jgi:hypothetical protein